ncbi:MAG: TonB-dependent receptor [Acidobacteriota bacterium]
MRLTRFLLLGIALIIAIDKVKAVIIVEAQSGGSTAGSIVGRVMDSQKAALVGASVKVRQIGVNVERTTVVKEDGTYQFLQLPPADYEVKVTMEGFKQGVEVITLNIGTTALVEFALVLNETQELIEINASALVNEGKTESSTNIDRGRINNLPINRRNFLDFSLTTARVVTDGVPVQGVAATSGLSFNGQSARFNNITIDGLDNNDLGTGSVRATFSQDSVQEFQVIADSYSAEFGRTLGGIINIVTKRGSNEFQGSIFFLNRSDELSAREVFSALKPNYQQYQFGVNLNIPINKDQAFLFTSFERLSIKQNNIVTIDDKTVASARRQGFQISNGPVPFAVGNTSLLARSDLQITSNDTLYIRYNFGGVYNGAREPFGALIAESSGGIQLLEDHTAVATNTFVSPNLNLINETRFLYGRREQDILAKDVGPQVRLATTEGLTIFGRATLLPQFRSERIYQIVNNTSLLRRRHQLKFGIDFIHDTLPDLKTNVPVFNEGMAFFTPLDFALLASIPGLPTLSSLQAFDASLRTVEQRNFLTLLSGLLPNMISGFPRNLPLADLALPFAYIQGFGDTRLEVSQNLFAAFLQDEIRIQPNILIKAGLRYDVNRVRFVPNNNGNISPRIAIAYKPAFSAKLRLHAAYGLFFAGAQVAGLALAAQNTSSGTLKLPVVPFPFSVLPFALPGHHFPQSNTLPKDFVFIPQLNQVLKYQQDLRNSYTQQINLGIDYFINDKTMVGINYAFVRGIKLLSVRNVNPIIKFLGDPITSSMNGRLDNSRGDVLELGSAYDSYYHGVTFSISSRVTNRFGLLAHYTWSKSIDNFIDLLSDLNEINNQQRIDNERALSLQDIRNRMVLSGTWEIDYTKNPLLRGFQLASIITVQSGRPYNLLAGVDLNQDVSPGDRPAGLGRNAGILPGFANIDLRLTRTFAITERYRLQCIVEGFNVFNRVNIKEIDRVFPPDPMGNFVLPPKQGGHFSTPRERFRGAFAPRQLQIGLRLSF